MTPEEVDRAVALAKNRLRLNPDLRDSLHTLIDRALLTEHSRANDSDASFDLRWKADMPAEPPAQAATDADAVARITAYLSSGGLFNPELANHDAVRNLLIDCRAELQRQAREIADKRAMLQNTNRDAARLAHLADKYKWQVRDTWTRAERAEAERDAMRECVRELVACADESDCLAAERLYGKPHTPEYKTRELDYRQRSIEAWKAARTKVQA